jgi:hypothetical protein
MPVNAMCKKAHYGLAVTEEQTFLGYTRLALIAGATGIVTSIVFHQDGWKMAFVRACCGASCVLFVAPVVIQWLGRYVEMSEQMSGLVFWAAGMGGIAIVTACRNMIAKAMRIPLAMLQEWLRIKQGGEQGK